MTNNHAFSLLYRSEFCHMEERKNLPMRNTRYLKLSEGIFININGSNMETAAKKGNAIRILKLKQRNHFITKCS